MVKAVLGLAAVSIFNLTGVRKVKLDFLNFFNFCQKPKTLEPINDGSKVHFGTYLIKLTVPVKIPMLQNLRWSALQFGAKRVDMESK